MLRYLSLVILFTITCLGHTNAQITNAPEQNCPGAIPVCHGDYQQNNTYAGSGTITELTTGYPCGTTPIGNNGALNSGERNGVWYVINVICPGYFCFNLEPNTPTDDYDWAIWDITGGGCSLIYNYTTNTPNPYPPLGSTCIPTYSQGCSNYQPNLGIPGWTGLSNNPTVLASNLMFNQAPYVNAGQTIALLVSNFTGYTGAVHGYHLSFDSSTACLYDTLKPAIIAAGSKCGFVSNNINITMNVPVSCNTLAPDGSDFYITDAATNLPVPGITTTGESSTNCTYLLTTTTFNLQFSNTLPAGSFWLHPQVGTDGNTIVDPCLNAQKTTDSFLFTLSVANPPAVKTIDTPACNKVRLIFDRGVKCSTVDLDGSDFTISGPGPVSIKQALLVSCTDIGLVDTIDLLFDGPIVVPGQYTITFGTGHDGNMVQDTCGEVVVSVPVFNVSDGGLTATAYPNLLCNPGYFELGAGTVMLPPPAAIVNCGANGTPCNNGVGYQVGAGTNAMSAAHTPFGGTMTQRRTRMIFTAAELNALGVKSGTISQVAFNVLTKASTKPFNNFTIKMGCIPATQLDSTNSFAGTFTPALEIVYGPKTYTTNAGWNNFQLDNTYDWNATQSLLVEICYSDTASTGGDDIVEGTPTPLSSFCVYTVNSTIEGCALSSLTGVFDVNRPNMQFVHCALDTLPKFSWMWTPNQFLYNGLADTTSAFAPQTTVYTATILDKDNCYRRDTALLTVSVRHPQLDRPIDTAVCIGSPVILHVEGGVSYAWYPTAGLSCDSCPNPTVTVDTTSTYHVGIYDQYNCGDTLQETVVVNPLPIITVTPKDTLELYKSPVQIEAYAPGARYYIWAPAVGLDNPDSPDPLAAPDSNTKYILTVIDTNKCSNKDSVTIRIYERGVEIPSAFTPNGDGKNDVFRVANLTTQKVAEFRVFNRWGQQVYTAEGSNEGWDGKYNGTEQPIGSYNYIIRVTFHDGSLKTFTGSVTLIR